MSLSKLTDDKFGSPMKVFFSWQSTSGRPQVTENYVRAALAKLNGVKVATSNPDHGKATSSVLSGISSYEIDKDTKGVSGSPPILATILDKIDSADVFVADLTPVEVDGRYFPNPNVMAEYGYALRSLGYKKIILLVNTNAVQNYIFEKMPFDIRSQRKPIEVGLGAINTKVVEIIANAIEFAAGAPRPFDGKYVPRSEALPGIILNTDEPIAYTRRYGDIVEVVWTAHHYFYMRLWPDQKVIVPEGNLEKSLKNYNRDHFTEGHANTLVRVNDGLLLFSSVNQNQRSETALGFTYWGVDGEVNLAIRINMASLEPGPEVGILRKSVRKSILVYHEVYGHDPVGKFGFVLPKGSMFPVPGDPTGRAQLIQRAHTSTDLEILRDETSGERTISHLLSLFG